MHIRISPQRALSSEDLDLGPLDFPKTWPMKPSRTWLRQGETELPARQAGMRNAYYSVGKGQQWMEQNLIDCGSVRYGHYLWDRAVWATAVIAGLLFDCETGTVVVTFHGAEDDDFHIVELSARLLLRLRAYLVHFHQLPFGSQAQLNLQSHLRSTCLDVFAQHVLPVLRMQDVIAASPTIWLAQRQRRNLARQASLFAAQIAEKLMLAVDGPLDPELEDWQKSHNDGSLWHCTEFLLSFNSRIDFGRRKASFPEGGNSSGSSGGSPSSPRSCSSCEGSDYESEDAGRSSPTPVANEGDDDDGECLRKAFEPFKNDFTLDQRALEWIEPRRMAKLCPPDLGKRGISIQKWDRAAIQSLENKICAVMNNIRRTEKLIEDEEAVERVRLASMQPDADELDKSWPPEKKSDKNNGKERSGTGHASTKKGRKSSKKARKSTKVAHAKKWAEALPVADPASEPQLNRAGREGIPGPYATARDDSPVITGKSAHETLLNISQAKMALERYGKEQAAELEIRKRKRQKSEAMTDASHALAYMTASDALNAEVGGASPHKKLKSIVRNANKPATAGSKKKSKTRNYFSSGLTKAVDAHLVKMAGGAADRSLDTLYEEDEEELYVLLNNSSQRRGPVVKRQNVKFVMGSSARIPQPDQKVDKLSTWSPARSSSESDEDDDDTDWQVKDRPFLPPSRFSAAMSARTSFNTSSSRPTRPMPGKVLRAARPKQPMPGRELVRQKSVHDIAESPVAARGSPTTVDDLGDGFDKLDMDFSSGLTDESSSDEEKLDDEPARFAAPMTEADDDEDVIVEEVSCSSSDIDVPPGLDYCIELGQGDDFELGILSPPDAGVATDKNTNTSYSSLFEERWSEVEEQGDMSFSSTESEDEEDMAADAVTGTSIAVPRLSMKSKVRATNAIGEEEDNLAPIRQFLQDQGTKEENQQTDASLPVNVAGDQKSSSTGSILSLEGQNGGTVKEAQCEIEETSFVQGMLELCGLKVHKSSSDSPGKGHAAQQDEEAAKIARAAARAALASVELLDGWLGLSSVSPSSSATSAMSLVHGGPRDVVQVSISGTRNVKSDKSPYAQTSTSSQNIPELSTGATSTPLTPRRSGTIASLSQNQRITKTYPSKRAAKVGNVPARAGGPLSCASREGGTMSSPGSPPRGPEGERRTSSQSPYRTSSLSANPSGAAPLARESGPMDVNQFLASLAA